MLSTVRSGDTLFSLARHFGIPLRDLLAANPQIDDPDQIFPGQTILIPSAPKPGSPSQYVVRPGDTMARIAHRLGINLVSLLAAHPPVENPNFILPGQLINIPANPLAQYVPQPVDTLFLIAHKFGVSVQDLISANPQVLTHPLPGQVLVIPRPPGPNRIVSVAAEYGYQDLRADITTLLATYPFLSQQVIGYSVLGRPIPAVKLGQGPHQVCYCASFHANEWIMTPVLMRFVEDYARAYRRLVPLHNANVRDLFQSTTIWVVPMVNPDGVELVQQGITPGHPYFEAVIAMNAGSRNFDTWKANIRGVDLNDQFPANWAAEKARGRPEPAPRDHSGPRPLSEPEAVALAELTRRQDFQLVIAFHTQGEVIFWGYRDLAPPESEEIAARMAARSGYTAVRNAGSDAGYKDWFIQEWRRPGFTVEGGRGINPLPITHFPKIYADVLPVMLCAAQP